MAAYTYSPAPVLVETTGEFAIGATGAFKDATTGAVVQVYDLNDSPISNVAVGAKGAHQAFKADIPNGVLDFGSVLLPAVSIQQEQAGLAAVTTANSALTQSTDALDIAQDALDAVAAVGKTTTITTQAGTSYTLTLADLATEIDFSSNSAISVVIPTNAAVAFPIGGSVIVRPIGTGQITVSGPGVSLSARGGALKSAGQFGPVVLTKYGTNSWFVDGDTTT